MEPAIMEKADIVVGIERLERVIQKREEEAMKQQQMMLEQQQAAAAQAQAQLEQMKINGQQLDAQSKLNLATVQGDYKIKDTEIKGAQKTDEIILQAQVDSNQSKQDYVEDSNLQRQKIKAELGKLKQNATARKSTK